MGIAFKVKSAWIGVGGKAKIFWPPGEKLSNLPLGSEIIFDNKAYTLIAHSGFVSGDAVLWTKNGSSKGTSAITYTNTTPFGAGNTNQASITYRTYNGRSASYYTRNAYGVLLPLTTLDISTISSESPAKFPYFDSNAKRVRYDASGTAYAYGSPTENRVYMEYNDGSTDYVGYQTYIGSSGDGGGTNKKQYSVLRDIYAYSVKGDLIAKPNSNGTYTLQI